MDSKDRQMYDELSRINNELATAQRQMVKLNADLAASNTEKNRLLGIVSHDLRNPLAVIAMNCSLLRDEVGATVSQDVSELLKDSQCAAELMKRLVDDLLDFSKVNASSLTVHAKAMDIVTLARRAVLRGARIARAKSTTVTADFEVEAFPIVADESRIEQVLNNLIGNAVTYSEPGSVVTVRLGRRGAHAVLSVVDRGPGLRAEEIACLFKPFAVGAARGTGGEKSTGLGLAIIDRIVAAHGGRVDVISCVGAGTTFEVWLPVEGPHGRHEREG